MVYLVKVINAAQKLARFSGYFQCLNDIVLDNLLLKGSALNSNKMALLWITYNIPKAVNFVILWM